MEAAEEYRAANAQAGDRRTFDAVSQSHRGELLKLCMRFLGRQDDAEDVVQETFSRAWENLRSYRGDASMRTWLWEIARNLCLNRLRARKSLLNQKTFSMNEPTGSAKDQVIEIPDTQPTPEEQTLDVSYMEHIRSEIVQCAEEKKWQLSDWALFALRIENSIAYAEFARIHGRDESYWRNRWRDKIKPALERVRYRLEKTDV